MGFKPSFKVFVIRGERGTTSTDGTEPRLTFSTVTAAVDPSHRQEGRRNRGVRCGLQHWSSQPAGEPKPHRLVFGVVKIPPFTPSTTPIKEIKEIEDLESNQCTISILPKIKSPIRTTLTLEIESNGICVFFFFSIFFFLTFLTLSRRPLSLSLSHPHQ
jgi:hypothetical protein